MAAADIRGAGVVAWKPAQGAGEARVLLVHRTKKRGGKNRETKKGKKAKREDGAKIDWSLPKGKLTTKEKAKWAGQRNAIYTAVHEVLEEAQVEVRLGPPLGPAEYWTYDSPRTVAYYAAEVVKDPGSFAPGDEVDDIKWLPLPKAREYVTFVADQRILDKLPAVLPVTKPVIFLRNAQPEEGGEDLARRLDATGQEQAGSLARLLSCFGSLAVLSSEADRCRQTIMPYTEMHRRATNTLPALSRGQFDKAEACRQIEHHVRHNDGVIVCSHHEELPALAKHLFGPDAGLFDQRKLRFAEFVVFHARLSGETDSLEAVGKSERVGLKWKGLQWF